jgi:RNA polymerase sigma factor (sigma-70 family)
MADNRCNITLGVRMATQEKALLDAFRDGSTWAFDLIFRQYEEPLRRFVLGGFSFNSQGRVCRYRGGSQLDVDGVVQETFARLFAPATRRTYDGERPLKNYIFSIAKNLVLRELARTDRARPTDLTEECWGSAPTLSERPERSPEKLSSDQQLTAIVNAFAETLEADERDIFRVRFVEEETQEAAALTLGVTRARVKTVEKDLRDRFLAACRTSGYFVGYEPKARWKRAA